MHKSILTTFVKKQPSSRRFHIRTLKLGSISIHAEGDGSQGLKLSNTLFLAHSQIKNSTLQSF